MKTCGPPSHESGGAPKFCPGWTGDRAILQDDVHVIRGLPNDEYHSQPQLSSSQLKTFYRSRREYEAIHVTGTMDPDYDKDPLKKGTALHTALLEPDKIEDEIVEVPNDVLLKDKNGRYSRRGKSWEQFKEENAGKILLLPAQVVDVLRMAESIRKDPKAGPLLRAATERELSVFWEDGPSGFSLRVRFDAIADSVILDLKSSAAPSPPDFRFQAWKLGYHLQEPMYRAGLKAMGISSPTFIFVAVKSKAPYTTFAHYFDVDTKYRADKLFKEQLEKLRWCYRVNDFSENNEGSLNAISIPERFF